MYPDIVHDVNSLGIWKMLYPIRVARPDFQRCLHLGGKSSRPEFVTFPYLLPADYSAQTDV